MRLLLVASLVALAAVPAGGARTLGKSWANGAIMKVSPTEISVRGTVTLAVPDGANGTKTTLDGMHRLSCDVNKSALVKGYHVGGKAKIVCSSGVLLQIAHV